ncbi:hypothetical protein B9T31_16530 [Acinetobacter sp. ANC 4558]|uniref:FAD-dependent oxidoreductase n=1 Tax=Acinetobacter sp. ANC 4558 TaxID=1977876 RepID=UPI000A3408C2|nr:FAD-dependent oxidoreductase [Acinetobacter sp. ANC 4558]OTG79847.1 hypothetical protein B9T31_16530 [Acinetobacter sp. ANC 4558]
MPNEINHILVVGAGIAGCSAAIAFRQLGKKVTIIEKSPEIQFNSSGIFIYSNGLYQFNKLGVLKALLAAGFIIENDENQYFTETGLAIVNTYYPRINRDIPGILGIKRAQLHHILLQRMQELGVTLNLGVTVKTLMEDTQNNTVHVSFNQEDNKEFDLVIGADGIRSQMRSWINPDIQPHYTGFGVWRSVHARPHHLTTKIMQMGMGKRVGVLPINPEQMYMFGTIVDHQNTWKPRDQWHNLMKQAFSDFTGGEVVNLFKQLNSQSEILYTAVEEIRMPLPWNKGRTIVIGDAAHASTPFMGQGGAMAVQDACELAEMLQYAECHDHPLDLVQLLQKFSEKRFAMCKFVQDISRAVGENGATETSQDCLMRNQYMQLNAQTKVDDFYKKLLSFT